MRRAVKLVTDEAGEFADLAITIDFLTRTGREFIDEPASVPARVAAISDWIAMQCG
jgi:hypothetical protein